MAHSLSLPLVLAGLLLFGQIAIGKTDLPTVDLGYQIHQAISFNETTSLYNFTNIRFAQPPVGELRFAAPRPPIGRNKTIQRGTTGKICPQVFPAWTVIENYFQTAYLNGTGDKFNMTAATEAAKPLWAKGAPNAPVDPRTDEDCLFLDVVVPKAIFDKRSSESGKCAANSTLAPVLVWIYGGGYVTGEKSAGFSDPSGLLGTSQKTGSPGFVSVALNYRTGAFGWMSGPSFRDAGGVSNAGLLDQRLGLEWVKTNIHLFGGDPNRVTVYGQSAGAGSIEHHLISHGGSGSLPFQQAIIQSPGYYPIASQAQPDKIYKEFLDILNVSSLAEARKLSSNALIAANLKHINESQYATFTYGPTVDGAYVPNLPSLLFASGSFHRNISVMTSHVYNEGVWYMSPYVTTDAQLRGQAKKFYPSVQDDVLDQMVKLYPGVYNGSQPWRTPVGRTKVFQSELIFQCNTNFIHKALHNQTYAMRYDVPPAIHGVDPCVVFFTAGKTTNETCPSTPFVVNTMQGYWTNFVLTGNPNGGSLPHWHIQGHNGSMITVNYTGVKTVQDDTANSRCDWMGKALFT